MNIVILIARLLLGLVFTVFGLNGFLHFIPMPPPAASDASDFFGVMMRTHYMIPVFTLQIAGGILMLIGRFIPLALVLLGPVIVNIDLFHLLIARSDYPMPILVTVLWSVVFFGYRFSFRPIFQSR